MARKEGKSAQNQGGNAPNASNVKSTPKYQRFGETIRYLTVRELRRFFDVIDNYRHKLMMRIIYQLGCRVGEFVRIRLQHLDFGRSNVLIPAENTKTGQRRSSYLSRGLMNEVKSKLRREDRMNKTDQKLRKPEQYLFQPPGPGKRHYTENRIRQIFMKYVRKAGLDRSYATDTQGRKLHRFTVHSLRHSHIMHHIHVYRLPLAVVQKQVGHRSLKGTTAYLKPSSEAVARAYESVGSEKKPPEDNPFSQERSYWSDRLHHVIQQG